MTDEWNIQISQAIDDAVRAGDADRAIALTTSLRHDYIPITEQLKALERSLLHDSELLESMGSYLVADHDLLVNEMTGVEYDELADRVEDLGIHSEELLEDLRALKVVLRDRPCGW